MNGFLEFTTHNLHENFNKKLKKIIRQIRVHLQYLGEISALMRFVDDESRLHCEDE
jgi:hypothetical protein